MSGLQLHTLEGISRNPPTHADYQSSKASSETRHGSGLALQVQHQGAVVLPSASSRGGLLKEGLRQRRERCRRSHLAGKLDGEAQILDEQVGHEAGLESAYEGVAGELAGERRARAAAHRDHVDKGPEGDA